MKRRVMAIITATALTAVSVTACGKNNADTDAGSDYILNDNKYKLININPI